MKNKQTESSTEIIDEHAYCPRCQYEFTARLIIVSETQNLVQTNCPKCKSTFDVDLRNINKKYPWPLPKVAKKMEEKLYDWPNQTDYINPHKLSISYYGRSNISSPLLISDPYGNPSLLKNEKILAQAIKIKSEINVFKKPMRKSINIGEGIFRNMGPGTLFRTNWRLIYIRRVQLGYHSGQGSILALGTLLEWKNNGYHESFSVPLSKITDIKISTGRGGILIFLDEPMEVKVYEVSLYPFKRMHRTVDDLLKG